MLLLIAGCGFGTISSITGSDPLETAFYVEADDPDTASAYLLLSNSYLSTCEDPQRTDDPSAALEELAIGVSREGARLAILRLRSFEVQGWEGVYPLASDSFQPNELSGATPFISEGSYLEVREAELSDEEGLEREYTITDAVYASPVAAPGEVLISSWSEGGTLAGQLRFESLDVSSRFRAQPCDVDYEDSILRYTDQLEFFFSAVAGEE